MSSRAGAIYALLAYASWGVLPIYWKLLAQVPAHEILMHRVLWTALFALALAALVGRRSEIGAILRNRRHLLALVASSLLLAGNWLTFIWAVNRGQIVATSLGYYLNPLVSVGLGVLLLRERLRPLQLVAVAIACVGVGAFALQVGHLPWIALWLAASFALYGLIRKTVPVASIAGLAVEAGLLAPLAALGIAAREASGAGAFARAAELGPRAPFLLVAAGVVTALPLIWFASAARRLRLASLGLFQYLAPSLSLAIAVVGYGEPFTRAHAIAFACIWSALALYSFESLRALR